MFDFDNVGRGYEFVGVIDNHAVIGVFADGTDIKDVLTTVDKWTFKGEGNDFEVVWVDDERIDASDGAAGLDAKNSGANKT